MPTGFGIAKQINDIVKKHNLSLIEIVIMGPRFFIGLYKKNNKKAILKMSMSHFRESHAARRICRRLNRESKFLDFVRQHKDPILKKSLPKLIDFETRGRVWYLKEYFEAEPQNLNKSNFLFKRSFFNDEASTFLAQFFSSLHRASKDFPSSFKRILRKYSLESHQGNNRCFEILDYYNLGHLNEKVKKFLDTKREIFDKNQNVITHYETYAPHILKNNLSVNLRTNNFYLIDWENVGWGNPARDITTLWIRSFARPDWQKDLIEKFLKFSSPEQKKYFKVFFEIEVVLQSIFKMDYFRYTRDRDELRVKDKVLRFLRENLKKVLGERLLINY
jgi:hypothetical protein